MEPDFKHTRAELASMIDGELHMFVNALSDNWWKLQEVMRTASDLVTQLHESSRQLQHWVQEIEPVSLPFEDRGQDQDHQADH